MRMNKVSESVFVTNEKIDYICSLEETFNFCLNQLSTIFDNQRAYRSISIYGAPASKRDQWLEAAFAFSLFLIRKVLVRFRKLSSHESKTKFLPQIGMLFKWKRRKKKKKERKRKKAEESWQEIVRKQLSHRMNGHWEFKTRATKRVYLMFCGEHIQIYHTICSISTVIRSAF